MPYHEHWIGRDTDTHMEDTRDRPEEGVRGNRRDIVDVDGEGMGVFITEDESDEIEVEDIAKFKEAFDFFDWNNNSTIATSVRGHKHIAKLSLNSTQLNFNSN